jgi:tellurite resistance protein
MIDHQSALIYTMVLVSAADREMTDAELTTIGDSVKHLPVFRDYDSDKLVTTAAQCAETLNEDDGFEKVIEAVKENLPAKLAETAYALACDVAAADGEVSQEEMELLAVIRQRLSVGRLPAAAIERGARARHMTV